MMKTIQISDEDYAALVVASDAARMSREDYLEVFIFNQTREYAENLPYFLREHICDWIEFDNEADARKVAAIANQDNDSHLFYAVCNAPQDRFVVRDFLKNPPAEAQPVTASGGKKNKK